jgi:hypothetical protein
METYGKVLKSMETYRKVEKRTEKYFDISIEFIIFLWVVFLFNGMKVLI